MIRLTLALLVGLITSAHAKPVIITLDGKVTLSEVDDYPEEDTVTATIRYDTETEGTTFHREEQGLTVFEYSGITASFRNASGTFSAETENASIFITQLAKEGTGRLPYHEMRLKFPIEDMPLPESRTLTSFIGFISLSDRSRTQLADGNLPETIDLEDYDYGSFLFAWNRFRGDEAPLEYDGNFESPKRDPEPIPLGISTAIELDFPTRDGGRYQIEYSDDLETWQPLGAPIDGDGNDHRQLVSTRESPLRTFRVQEIRE